ncbi:hypothetical protein BJY59DRAFT_379506 [Rhodotorula toruloides]
MKAWEILRTARKPAQQPDRARELRWAIPVRFAPPLVAYEDGVHPPVHSCARARKNERQDVHFVRHAREAEEARERCLTVISLVGGATEQGDPPASHDVLLPSPAETSATCRSLLRDSRSPEQRRAGEERERREICRSRREGVARNAPQVAQPPEEAVVHRVSSERSPRRDKRRVVCRRPQATLARRSMKRPFHLRC